MALEITSLRIDERVTPAGNLWYAEIPYLSVNATFRITEDEHLLERTKAEASEYSSVLTIDDPERYETWIANQCGFDQFRYDGYGRAWTSQDPPFYYLEKFQTFHFRQFVADSSVTRAILAELTHFKQHGKLPSVYRHAEEYVVISLFHMLDRLWD